MKEEIILIGGGGHAKSVIDAIKSKNDYYIVGILDMPDKVGQVLEGVKVIGTDDEMNEYYRKGVRNALITLGSTGDSTLRVKLYQKLKQVGYQLPNIADSSAVISQSVRLGEGCFIGKGAIVNAGVMIGDNVIVNTGSIVEHDCTIGDFVHLAPRSTVCGQVKIDKGTHVGAGATIIQGVTIGKGSLIGAGSVVIKNLRDHIKAYGCPCKEVGKNESNIYHSGSRS